MLFRSAKRWLLEHLDDHYGLYGEYAGVRTARKHIGWAVRTLPGGELFRAEMNLIETCESQVRAVGDWFDALADRYWLWPAGVTNPHGEPHTAAANHATIRLSA